MHPKMSLNCNQIKTWLFFTLPRCLIIFLCATLFTLFTTMLLIRYFNCPTTVYVDYQKALWISYPAVTVCGPRQPEPNLTLAQVFQQNREPLKKFISACVINRNYDRLNPKSLVKCTELRRMMVSSQDSRFCQTYLTFLVETEDMKRNEIISRDDYTSTIELWLDFRGWHNSGPKFTHPKDAGLVFAVHAPDLLTDTREVHYYTLEPGKLYEAHFWDVTQDFDGPRPWPKCRDYNRYNGKPPRSRSECLHLCMLDHAHHKEKCISWNSAMTLPLMTSLSLNQSHFCHNHHRVRYYLYAALKELCHEQHCSSGCFQQHFVTTVMEHRGIRSNQSRVQLIPQKVEKPYIRLRPELVPCNLWAYIGGNAHIWLGHSMICTYEKLCLVLSFLYQWFKVHFDTLAIKSF